MVRHSFSSAPGSWLERRRSARLSDTTFSCGIRVVDGHVEGETGQWRVAPSAFDELVIDGVTALNHGPVRLRVRATADDPTGTRPPQPGWDVVAVTELATGARLEIALDPERAEQLRHNSR